LEQTIREQRHQLEELAIVKADEEDKLRRLMAENSNTKRAIADLRLRLDQILADTQKIAEHNEWRENEN
jgi:chromosome segregation ATPase